MDAQTRQQVRRRLTDATLQMTLARAVVPILRATPEYEAARAERRAKKWLDAESLSLGYALAEVVRARLDDLDPYAGAE